MAMETKTKAVFAVALIICVIIAFVAGMYLTPPREVVVEVEKTVPVPLPYSIPGGKIWVPILNKFMTHEELVAEIKAEGEVMVADWTYWGLVDTYFIPSFQKYVKDRYGVDVKMDIVGTQEAKGGFMFQLYSAYAAGMAPPYDAMHIELNFYPEAVEKGIAEPFLPSALVPNLNLLDPVFFEPWIPYGVQFQQHAWTAPVVNLEKAGWMKSWLDYADPRLKGKITLWVFTDNGFWAYLTVTATALGYDYKKPDEMKKAIEWVAENVHPNVLKYTSDEAEIIELSEGNVTWVNSYWCCSPEMEQAAGRKWLGPVLLEPFMPNLAGVVWIPKDTKHPVLAQLYVDWLLSPEFQFPDIKAPGFAELDPTMAKQLWAGMTEGPLGPYYEQFIPEWWGTKEDYYKVYPRIEDIYKYYKPVDWAYVTEHAEEWIKYYESLIA